MSLKMRRIGTAHVTRTDTHGTWCRGEVYSDACVNGVMMEL
jgi:hypothetical protein